MSVAAPQTPLNATTPARPKAWLRTRRVGAVFAAVCLLVLATVAAAEWAGWPFLRLPIARQLSALAGVPVLIEAPFSVHLLGTPRLAAAQLTVGAAAGTSAPFLLDANNVQLQVRWADLWTAARGGGVRVEALLADNLTAHLLRNANGQASWQIGAKPTTAPTAHARPLPKPVVERLGVRQASITLDDQTVPLHLDVQVSERAERAEPAEPSEPADKAIAQPAAGSAAVAGVRVKAQGRYRRAQVQAQFDIDDMLSLFVPHRADKTAAFVKGQATVGRAKLEFDGVLGGLAQAPVLRGTVSAKGPSVGLVMAPLGLSLPQTPAFFVHGQLSLDGPVWGLAADRIDVGRSRLAGRFAYDKQRQPALLSGQLNGALLALKDLAPSIGAQAPVAERGRVFPETRLDIPSLTAMDADVQVAINSLDFGTTAVAPLSALRVHVTLCEGLLSLNQLSAQVAGGTVRGSSSLLAKGEQAQWKAALQFDGIGLSQWLRPLQVAAPQAAQTGPQTPKVPLASGALNARISLLGQGRSVAEVLAGADGQVQATLSGGTLSHLVTEAAGLDVAQALGIFIRGDKSLALRCARVQARVSKGVVGPVQGVLDNSDSVLKIDGQIDLRSEALDLRLVVQPKDFSPLSLRSPVRVRGSLSQARLSVEGGRIAARVLGALALGTVAPVLAWVPLLDAGNAAKEDPCVQVQSIAGGKQKPPVAAPGRRAASAPR